MTNQHVRPHYWLLLIIAVSFAGLRCQAGLEHPNDTHADLLLVNHPTQDFIFSGGLTVSGKRCGTWVQVNKKGKIITQIEYDMCDTPAPLRKENEMKIVYFTEYGSRLFEYFVRDNHVDSIAFACHTSPYTVRRGDSAYQQMTANFRVPF